MEKNVISLKGVLNMNAVPITHLKSASGYNELSKHDLKKYLVKVASGTTDLVVTHHASDRMRERQITRNEIFNVLRRGEPDHSPFFNANEGTWECSILGRSAGVQIRVAIALQLMDPDDKTYVIVVTAFHIEK